eukprot:TRINITY_DN1004_c0_g1_i3.p1 TRINITY_DN1004_c0_g1~~TRINITY_DN1004_c0_g1_i3.p1  ORF type:complete len:185 (+),score=20.88 TRINITY_DN1004_c0_g1_i3:268-822(+)
MCDPYLKMWIQGKPDTPVKTKVIKNTCNPSDVGSIGTSTLLHVQVWDSGIIDTFLGKFSIPLSEFTSLPDENIDRKYKLLPSNKLRDDVSSEVQLNIRYRPKVVSNKEYKSCGSFNFKVNKLNNLKKSGKYCCVIEYYDTCYSYSCNWQTGLIEGGVWNQSFHCWVGLVPSVVVIHVLRSKVER